MAKKLKPSITERTPINVPCNPCAKQIIAKPKKRAHVLDSTTNIFKNRV